MLPCDSCSGISFFSAESDCSSFLFSFLHLILPLERKRASLLFLPYFFFFFFFFPPATISIHQIKSSTPTTTIITICRSLYYLASLFIIAFCPFSSSSSSSCLYCPFLRLLLLLLLCRQSASLAVPPSVYLELPHLPVLAGWFYSWQNSPHLILPSPPPLYSLPPSVHSVKCTENYGRQRLEKVGHLQREADCQCRSSPGQREAKKGYRSQAHCH